MRRITNLRATSDQEDWIQHLKDYREFLQWDEYGTLDYDGMTQMDAKKRLEEYLVFIAETNGAGELFETERHYAELLGIDLSTAD